MMKKVFSVLVVLCMMLTFVPFVGSAASITGGYLMLDSTKSASGEGWSWDGEVLTLGQTDEFNAILASVPMQLVLTEDVELGGALLASDGGVITTGEYKLTVNGGINGNVITIYDSVIDAKSVFGTALTIIDSEVISDCSEMTYAVGMYADELVIDHSIVTACSSFDEGWTGTAIVAGTMTATNSIVNAHASVYGIMINEPSEYADGVLTVDNSTIVATGAAAAIAACVRYNDAEIDYNTIQLNDVQVVAPEYASLGEGSYVNDYGSTAKFATIVDVDGAAASCVLTQAINSALLPDGEFEPEIPDVPEIPDEPTDPEEPEIPDNPSDVDIQEGIYGEMLGETILLTIITEGTSYDRVALFYAEDTSLAGCLMVTDNYVEYDCEGVIFCQWTLEIDVPTVSTSYVVKCRDAATQSYKNGKTFPAFTIDPPAVEFVPETTMLYVGGVNAFENPEGDGWYFDQYSSTLTLENCTLTDTGTFTDAEGGLINAVIYARGDLIINIIGDNYIANNATQLPTQYTTYGGIWLDASHDDYAQEELIIVGEGTLTAGVAISQEVYKTGFVEFSFGAYVFNEYGVDLTGLGAGSRVDVYGGVEGVPATYNVRAYHTAPNYLDGNTVTAYMNMEGTMLIESGFDAVNNEAWRVIVETSAANITADGALAIWKNGEAYGNGWSWKDGVLTLGNIEGLRFIEFGWEIANAKIVLTSDVTIDAYAINEEDAMYLRPAISFAGYNTDCRLEIYTGDYTLTVLNDRASAFDVYGTLAIIGGEVYAENIGVGYADICVNGNLEIIGADVTAAFGGIEVYDNFDYDADDYVGGNITIRNSTVYSDQVYAEDEYGDVCYGNAICSFGVLTIDGSEIYAQAVDVAIYAENGIVMNNSTVSAGSINNAIFCYDEIEINNTSIYAYSEEGYAIVTAPYDYDVDASEDDIRISGVTFFEPEAVQSKVIVNSTEWYDEQFTVLADADGNALNFLYAEANSSVSYEIINGKLTITVVTETNINRIGLFGADGKCIKTFNTYEVNEDGFYVWTIKMNAPMDEALVYTIKGRDAASQSYKKGITFSDVVIEPEVVIDDVKVESRGDKVYVTVTTVSFNYDRIAIWNPITGKYVKYTNNYEFMEDGSMVWTLVFDYDEAYTSYIVRARDFRTNKYNTVQQAEIEVGAPVEPVIDVTVEEYDEDNLVVVITTIPELYRVKVSAASNPTGCIAYAKAPVAEGDVWVWEVVIPRSSESELAVDVAYTSKAYARYFTYFEIA